MPGRGFIIFWIFLLFFFGIFFPGSSMNGILEWNFVFTFSVILIPFSEKIKPVRGFIIFWIFLLFFFQNFLARFEYERNSGVKFCLHFFGLSPPVLAKNNAGKRFYNFSNFFTIFFRNFLARVEYERNSGVKFCLHFFGLSPPVLATNNAGNRFYNFLNFFTIFFGISLPRSSMNGILEWNFVFTFSAYVIPFWLKIMPGRDFIIFWIFLQFFPDFSYPGRVWTEFWSEILFSLFRPMSSRFG